MKDVETHILWTGGWDSTFRLLYLVLYEKRNVQPHYVVTGQESTGKEIETMYRISGMLYKKYPFTRDLLKPVIVQDVKGISPNEKITDEYLKIKRGEKVNMQYEFLARYCDQIGIKAEVCVEPYLDGFKSKYLNKGYIFDDFFFYPLIDTPKKKMEELSQKYGWMDIMKETWFCRVPKNGKPCGVCAACVDVVMGKMGYRLPFRSRVLAKIQLPFRKLWRNNYKYQSKAPLKYIFNMLSGRV